MHVFHHSVARSTLAVAFTLLIGPREAGRHTAPDSRRRGEGLGVRGECFLHPRVATSTGSRGRATLPALIWRDEAGPTGLAAGHGCGVVKKLKSALWPEEGAVPV